MCRCLLLLLAFFAPPLAVLFDRGCGRALLLNCLLTLCFFIPGVIHAFMLILGDGHRRDEHDHHHHHHTEEVIVTRNVQYVGQPVVVEQVHGHHHHHHYDEVVIGQPVIVGQQVLQPQYLGQGVAAYQPPPVYPNIK
ncbi:unnamed protein product [Heligmosomoides polygyrus]|uniref:Protein SNA3 n=1 Tax=Heligmosomoides polygyrus TaxID=6339 RepID=A0A183FKS8_HELPZ|nr:unnamed protein product [Heligmosomoides polygyrus]